MKFKRKQEDTVVAVQIPAGAFDVCEQGDKQGTFLAEAGDWLVFHSDGSFEVLSEMAFEEKYMPVEPREARVMGEGHGGMGAPQPWAPAPLPETYTEEGTDAPPKQPEKPRTLPASTLSVARQG